MKDSYNFLKEYLKEDDTLIVAVSGGPDSMALINIVLDLSKIKKINIICAHVNHNTGRNGQIEEQKYVETFCKEKSIICETLLIDKYKNDNFECEARNKRYEYFDKLIKKYNAKYLLTAHHGDDLIETILMRIVRGSSLRGYSGFKKIVEMNNYKIIRPLINVTKDDILVYLEKNNIKYYIDQTNMDDNYTRNRYRKYMLPMLKKENKNVHNKFYKFSETLRLYDNYVEKQTKNIIKLIYKNNTLNLLEFKKLDYLLQIRIINLILEKLYNEDLNLINDIHVNNILNLINNRKSNSKIYLPNNLIIIKKYDKLEFRADYTFNLSYDIKLDKKVTLPNNYMIEIINSINSDSNYVCRLNFDEIQLPLRVRTKKNGDRMFVKGLNGTKKIKDIFIDSKIDKELRDSWPIVVDSNDVIVWLPGLKKSKFDKTKEEKYDIILKYQKKEEINE